MKNDLALMFPQLLQIDRKELAYIVSIRAIVFGSQQVFNC